MAGSKGADLDYTALPNLVRRALSIGTSGLSKTVDYGGTGTVSWLSPLFPGSTPDRAITAGQAAGLPSLHRATQVLVNPIVRMPWRVDTGNGPRPIPLWMRDPMLAGRSPGTPTPLSPAPDRLEYHGFWTQLLTHVLWYGRGFLMFAPSPNGEPIPGTLQVLNPFLVERDQDHWSIIDAVDGTRWPTDRDGNIDGFRVVQVDGLPPTDGGIGAGVVTRFAEALGLMIEVRAYARGSLSDNGVPSGVLTVTDPDFSSDDAQALRNSWQKAHGSGAGVAVLNAAVSYSAVSVKPVDAEVDVMRRMALVDVAHACNLPAWSLDAGADSSVYSNINDRRRDLVDLSMSPLAVRLMDTLTTLLPFGQTAHVDWRGFLLTAHVERLSYYRELLDLGVVDAAWIAAQENLMIGAQNA